MNKPKILLVLPYASFIGGVETMLIETVSGLAQYFDFVIAIPPGSYYEQSLIDRGAQVELLKMHAITKPRSIKMLIDMIFLFLPSINRLRQIITKHRIELVHSHKMNVIVGNLAAHLSGIPCMHTIHEVSTGGILFYRLIAAIIHRYSDRVVILCDESGKMFAGDWRNDSKIVKMHNGIEVNRFYRGSGEVNIRTELGLPEEAPLVMSLGRLWSTKGIEFLIKAAPKIIDEFPETHFLIVGDIGVPEHEPYRHKLEALVRERELTDRVLFLGARRDIPELLSAVSVFVCPSLVDIFPTVILEAMSSALPIVATRVGGIPEQIIDGETGVLVTPRDTAALAEAVIMILQDPDYAAEMGIAARRRAELLFNVNGYLKGTKILYEQLLK